MHHWSVELAVVKSDQSSSKVVAYCLDSIVFLFQRLLPVVQLIDLSHNEIKETGHHLEVAATLNTFQLKSFN